MLLDEMNNEHIRKGPLFIGFSADGKEKAFNKKIKNIKFVHWSDLKIEDGDIKVEHTPISQYPFVLIGTVGENYVLYSCLRAYLDKKKIPSFDYGVPINKDNKLLQSVLMKQYGINQIKTVICQANKTTAISLIRKLKLPVVSKIIDGSQGDGVEKHDTKDSLEKMLKKGNDEIFIFQEFIPNAGDFRVLFVRDKLIYSIKRVKGKDAFRNNVSLGGTQEFEELDKKAKDLAIATVKVMKFDITGVDLIQHKSSKEWYVMEINSAPQFTGPEFNMVVDALADCIK